MCLKSLSPLRYPGGKAKLYDYICNVFEANNLKNVTYVELFAGGAGLAISLLLNKKVKKIIINDIDYCIFCFWKCAVNRSDEFCQRIVSCNITIDEHEKQKKIYKDPYNYSEIDVAFATLFLNRTHRSGILNGGIIGGKSQEGKYKINCRFNKENIIERIKNIARYKDYITVTNLDAIDFISNQKEVLRKKCFFYIDPPYVVKGGDLYKNAFSIADHKKLAYAINKILRNRKWIITYDNHNLIEQLYSKNTIKHFEIQYTAQNKKRGEEIMIFSNRVKIPECKIL